MIFIDVQLYHLVLFISANVTMIPGDFTFRVPQVSCARYPTETDNVGLGWWIWVTELMSQSKTPRDAPTES